jgi:hypothetical protein
MSDIRDDLLYIRQRVDVTVEKLGALNAMLEGHIESEGHPEVVKRVASLERTRSWARGVIAFITFAVMAGVPLLLKAL